MVTTKANVAKKKNKIKYNRRDAHHFCFRPHHRINIPDQVEVTLKWGTCPHDLDTYLIVPWSTRSVGYSFGLRSKHPTLNITAALVSDALSASVGFEKIIIFGSDLYLVNASCFRFGVMTQIFSHCAGYQRTAATVTVLDKQPIAQVSVLSPEAGSYDFPDPCPHLLTGGCITTCSGECRNAYRRVWHALSFEMREGRIGAVQVSNKVQGEVAPLPFTPC